MPWFYILVSVITRDVILLEITKTGYWVEKFK